MYTFELTPKIAADVSRLEALRNVLDRGVLRRRWYGRLRRELEAAAVAASTSMEGVPVTVDEVRHILLGDRPTAVAEADAALVAGYRDAMSFVLRRADAAGFTWHSELIIAIHDRAMGGDHALGAGGYRRGQAYVGSGSRGLVYTPPDAAAIPPLVVELTTWLQQAERNGVPAPVRAALAHVRLAGIHPFADGNGRVSRVLASLVMYRGGYQRPEFTSLEEWWGSHLADYYQAFDCLGATWDPHVDVTPFVADHVRAQVTQGEALSLRLGAEQAIWASLEEVVTEELHGPPRMVDALFDAFFARDITNRYYRALADVGAPTAASDLRRLQSAGLLQATGAGRSTSYRGTARLVAVVARAAGLSAPDARMGLAQQRDFVVTALTARMHGAREE